MDYAYTYAQVRGEFRITLNQAQITDIEVKQRAQLKDQAPAFFRLYFSNGIRTGNSGRQRTDSLTSRGTVDLEKSTSSPPSQFRDGWKWWKKRANGFRVAL